MLGASCALGMFLGLKIQLPKIQNEHKIESSAQTSVQKITDVLSYIHAKYDDSLTYEQLADESIEGLLEELDPFSNYESAINKQDLLDALDGNYEGIGIVCRKLDTKIIIDQIIENSPASEQGLSIADQIISINDILLDSTSQTDDVIRIIRESKNKVNIVTQENKKFSLDKREIKLPSLTLHHSPVKGTAYVAIHTMGAKTYQELLNAIETYTTNNSLDKLIIDLRNNGGGYVSAAADILNQLIPDKDQFLFETYGSKIKTTSYKSLGRPFFHFKKIIILVNGQTASAAELIAGCLQDLDRATIIGSNTFGKGTILETFNLADQSMLQLVTGRYKLPSGRCIQRSMDNYILYNDENKVNKTYTSAIKKRKLLSESGLIPDIEIENPLDDTSSIRLNQITDSENFVLQHYTEIKKFQFKTAQDVFTNKELEKLIFEKYLHNNIAAFSNTESQKIIEEIKYSVIYFILGLASEKKASLEIDPVYKKALEL